MEDLVYIPLNDLVQGWTVVSIEFFYGNNEAQATALASSTASVIGGAVTIRTQDFTPTGDAYNAHDWTSFSFTLVANSSSITLKFLDTSHFPTNCGSIAYRGGSTLDSISVVAACRKRAESEPASRRSQSA